MIKWNPNLMVKIIIEVKEVSAPSHSDRKSTARGRMFEKVRLVNKMKIRMRRRKFSTRFFQVCVVTVVITLFLYFLFQGCIFGIIFITLINTFLT